MKKIIILIILFIIVVLFFYNQNINKTQYLDIYKKDAEEQKPNQKPKNAYIKNLQIKYKNIINMNLNGSLILEEKKFRLIANSIFGKELDVGINNKELWYWSKRSKPKGLFYSKIENLNKTNLKDALNPAWLYKATNIYLEKNKNSEIYNLKENQIIINKTINQIGQENSIVSVTDKKNEKILANYLYDSKGYLIVSAEVKEHQIIDGYYIPKVVKINWFRENIHMTWIFNQIKLNTIISDDAWKKPNIQPLIDIGK